MQLMLHHQFLQHQHHQQKKEKTQALYGIIFRETKTNPAVTLMAVQRLFQLIPAQEHFCITWKKNTTSQSINQTINQIDQRVNLRVKTKKRAMNFYFNLLSLTLKHSRLLNRSNLSGFVRVLILTTMYHAGKLSKIDLTIFFRQKSQQSNNAFQKQNRKFI